MRKNNDLPITFLFLAVIMLLLGIFVAKASADVGTIEIPSINCKFDLSWQYSTASQHQHIAMLYKTYGCQTVGNHYASASETGGYWKLENIKVGDKAYLDYITMDGMETIHHTGNYVCYAIFLADVVGHEFAHKGIEVRPFEPTDLICTTCVGWDSTRNYVAFFEKIS
jgi:hypothetical protein